MRKTMRETMRQEIMSVWDETEKDIKKRKSLIDFLKKNGIAQNTIYVYMRGECRRMPLFKLKGLFECIKEFKEIQPNLIYERKEEYDFEDEEE